MGLRMATHERPTADSNPVVGGGCSGARALDRAIRGQGASPYDLKPGEAANEERLTVWVASLLDDAIA